MSLSLYSTALVWHSQRGGVAKLHGRQVVLTEAPPILRLRRALPDAPPSRQIDAGGAIDGRVGSG